MVVRASAEESRRAVLGGLVAGLATLTASSANAIDNIIDDRKAINKGFNIIYVSPACADDVDGVETILSLR